MGFATLVLLASAVCCALGLDGLEYKYGKVEYVNIVSTKRKVVTYLCVIREFCGKVLHI